MKAFKILWAAALAICLSTACSKLDFVQLSSEKDFVAPTLTAPGAINLTADAIASQAPVTFSWTAADFGKPAEILYNINATYSGKNTVLLARLVGKEYSITADELAAKLIALGVPEGQMVNVTMNIDCSIGSDFISLKSADKTVSVFVE